ncbi:hypothetical protein [Mycolicibacterium llatzerense]|uniref:hypothetical protein n=1 Tax=Mycolicibacterium llatzerense TaxID=280871 RepID=UPI0008DCAAAC|nr:hypothetical protein [Mycolicibacterium llatzerense]
MPRKIVTQREQAEAMQDALEADADKHKPHGRYALPESVFGSPARAHGLSEAPHRQPAQTTADGRTPVPPSNWFDPVTEVADPTWHKPIAEGAGHEAAE